MNMPAVSDLPTFSSVRQFGAKRIDSVSDLEASGIDYKSISDSDELRKEFLDSKVVVTADNCIFTVSTQDPISKRCAGILKSRGVHPQTVICSEEVILHIQHFVNEDEQADGEGFYGDEKATQSESQRFFKEVINTAIALGASDVKFYIREKNLGIVQFKLHGEYRTQDRFSRLAREKYISMMRTIIDYELTANNGDSARNFNEAVPQDFQLPFKMDSGEQVKIRIGTIPGERSSLSVAMRIPQAGNKGKLLTLEEMGFAPWHIALIKQAIAAPYGLILFTGPTGSGKTTAIAAALKLRPDNSPVITLEDPVEISLLDKPALMQCPIDDEDEEKNWKAMLRQCLRQDPDGIMIGEIRDSDVAKTLNRAVGTGHLVLSTLHVNSVLDIPSQLEFYELPIHKIAEETFLRLCVASRLVKGVCANCSTPLSEISETSLEITRLKTYFHDALATVRVHNPKGCTHCGHTGIRGRQLIAEVVQLDGVGRSLILEQRYSDWKDHLITQGWIDMKGHAESKVRAGLVCPFEAEGNIVSPFGTHSGSKEAFNYSDLISVISEREAMNV